MKETKEKVASLMEDIADLKSQISTRTEEYNKEIENLKRAFNSEMDIITRKFNSDIEPIQAGLEIKNVELAILCSARAQPASAVDEKEETLQKLGFSGEGQSSFATMATEHEKEETLQKPEVPGESRSSFAVMSTDVAPCAQPAGTENENENSMQKLGVPEVGDSSSVIMSTDGEQYAPPALQKLMNIKTEISSLKSYHTEKKAQLIELNKYVDDGENSILKPIERRIEEKQRELTNAVALEFCITFSKFFLLLPDSENRIPRLILLAASVGQRNKCSIELRRKIINSFKFTFALLKKSSSPQGIDRTRGKFEALGVDTHVEEIWSEIVKEKKNWGALKRTIKVTGKNLGKEKSSTKLTKEASESMVAEFSEKEKWIIDLFIKEIVEVDDVYRSSIVMEQDIKNCEDRLEVYQEVVRKLKLFRESSRFGRTRKSLIHPETILKMRQMWSEDSMYAMESEIEEDEWKSELAKPVEVERERVIDEDDVNATKIELATVDVEREETLEKTLDVTKVTEADESATVDVQREEILGVTKVTTVDVQREETLGVTKVTEEHESATVDVQREETLGVKEGTEEDESATVDVQREETLGVTKVTEEDESATVDVHREETLGVTEATEENETINIPS